MTAASSHQTHDNELVARMGAGDRSAFAELFTRYRSLVYRFARQMSGSHETADDVTQDVFIALMEQGARFDPSRASLRTYLYGMSRHLVLQRFKRSAVRREKSSGLLGEDDARSPAVESDPGADLDRLAAVERLRRAVLALPLRYREVVVLCDLNELTYDEAACVVGCPVGTVRSRLSRARKVLAERCQAAAASRGDHARPTMAGRYVPVPSLE